MKTLTLIILGFISSMTYAQDNQKILNSYLEVLHLDEQKSKAFKEIIISTNIVLYKEDIDASTFNKELKVRQLKVNEILDKTQYETYLDLVKIVEPHLIYRYK